MNFLTIFIDENSCHLTVFMCVNPKGWIPPFIVNIGAPTAALRSFKTIQKVAAELTLERKK